MAEFSTVESMDSGSTAAKLAWFDNEDNGEYDNPGCVRVELVFVTLHGFLYAPEATKRQSSINGAANEGTTGSERSTAEKHTWLDVE